MSKPPCGLIPNSPGEQAYYGNAEIVIASRVTNLDLREHPLGRKQPSATKNRELANKITTRTASREEYKLYMWDKRLAKRRKLGIKRFWKQERMLLESGNNGTRNWAEEQRRDILDGKVPKFNGSPLQAHHSYSVSRYPHLANEAAVIYPATPFEHLKGWHGGSYQKSLPGSRIRKINEF